MGSSAVTNSGILFEDDCLRIRFDEGQSDEAVISFSGLGVADYRFGQKAPSSPDSDDQHATQIDEFRKTIDGTKNVYYVADKKRRWYNGLESKIPDLINSHLAQRQTKRVLTLGNSMGGSAALMFASRIDGCRHAMAFAPQSSVHPDLVPFENRWRNHRAKITQWTSPDPIASMEGGGRWYYVFYGMGDGRERQHIQRILSRNLPNVVIFGIEDCGHDVAAHLKDSGVPLKDIVTQAFAGRPSDVRDVIKDFPHKMLRAGVQSRTAGPEG
jgi:pimeloyl-ACP methyl ester carboxylesterase